MSAISKLIRQYEKECRAGHFEESEKIAGILDKKYKICTTFAVDLVYFIDNNINVLYSFQL